MSLPRPTLQQHMNELEDRLPALIRDLPDPAEFWPTFAGLADAIADAAGPDDFEWVQERMDAMLRHHGAPEVA